MNATLEKSEFQNGQLVSVNWERLGEITEVLPNGFYRVWVEKDCSSNELRTVHQNSLEAVR